MELPKVSIIIPVYNGANYMREAIDSALTQTYTNIEIIVVNDGSCDEGQTEKIALSYGDRIRYFSKPNGGSSSALNYGIRKMRGEYFSWLSHDDLYKSDKIEKQIQKINFEIINKQIIICGTEIIDSCGKKIHHSKKQLNGNFDGLSMLENIKKGYGINGCGVLIHKNILDKVGFFDENFRFINDFDYWYRLMIHDCIFTCFDEQLVLSRIHHEQVTVKKAHLFKSECELMSKKIFDSMMSSIDENYLMIKAYLEIVVKNGEFNVMRETIRKLNKKGYKQNVIGFYSFYLYGRIIRLGKEIYKKLFYRREHESCTN